MRKSIRDLLLVWAKQYEVESFITGDPVQFPRRYKEKRDVEISGFLTAYLSFGSRGQILKAANQLDEVMGHEPWSYVLSCRWEIDFPIDNALSFYRMVSYAKMNTIFRRLFEIYRTNMDMESALLSRGLGIPFERICRLFGVAEKSPQKKLNMFLRWMVRRNSPVDLGVWESFSPADLLIPLDTHVLRIASELGLSKTNSYSSSNVKVITSGLSEVFPGDPCRGDFALFGYGVVHSRVRKRPDW